MTVLVDMDDVLECLVPAWVDFLNKMYGTTTSAEDVTDWNIPESFPTLTPEQVFEAPSRDDFWKTVQPMPGAYEGLESLISDGHRIIVVTASWYGSVRVKMEDVLFRYYPFIKWEDVIIASRKQLIQGDVLIDDGPHNLVGGKYRKILFDQPHNRSFDEKSIGAVRVCNWVEVVREVRKMADEMSGSMK